MTNRRIAWIAALVIGIAALIVVETCVEKGRKPWTNGDIDDRMLAPPWDRPEH